MKELFDILWNMPVAELVHYVLIGLAMYVFGPILIALIFVVLWWCFLSIVEKRR